MKTKLSDWWIEDGYACLDVNAFDPDDKSEMRVERQEGDDPAKAEALGKALEEKGGFRVGERRH